MRNGLRIPILMYHSISEPSGRKSHPYYETCTSPKVFTEHMKFLHENNYQVITLEQAVKFLNSARHSTQSSSISPQSLFFSPKSLGFNTKAPSIEPPNEPITYSANQATYVVLTFDDGFHDFYTKAFTILQKYGFSATVFLPTAFIGDDRRKFMGKECLSWGEVRKLDQKGITFGSHTVFHGKLKELKLNDLKSEIFKSKETIEIKLKKAVHSFSYPFAFPQEDEEFIRALKNLLHCARYGNGVTTKIGTSDTSDDPLFLKRIPVNEWDDILFFEAKLLGAYDWLFSMQDYYKNARMYLR